MANWRVCFDALRVMTFAGEAARMWSAVRASKVLPVLAPRAGKTAPLLSVDAGRVEPPHVASGRQLFSFLKASWAFAEQ